MKDSTANRKKILLWLESRGGEHRSGQNDNVFGFIYRSISPASYSHHAVTEMRQMLEAMAHDELVILESNEIGKVVAVRLSVTEHATISEEETDITKEELYSIIHQLREEVRRASKVKDDTLAAFELLSGDDVSSQELEQAQAETARLSDLLLHSHDESECERRFEELEKRYRSELISRGREHAARVASLEAEVQELRAATREKKSDMVVESPFDTLLAQIPPELRHRVIVMDASSHRHN